MIHGRAHTVRSPRRGQECSSRSGAGELLEWFSLSDALGPLREWGSSDRLPAGVVEAVVAAISLLQRSEVCRPLALEDDDGWV